MENERKTLCCFFFCQIRNRDIPFESEIIQLAVQLAFERTSAKSSIKHRIFWLEAHVDSSREINLSWGELCEGSRKSFLRQIIFQPWMRLIISLEPNGFPCRGNEYEFPKNCLRKLKFAGLPVAVAGMLKRAVAKGWWTMNFVCNFQATLIVLGSSSVIKNSRVSVNEPASEFLVLKINSNIVARGRQFWWTSKMGSDGTSRGQSAYRLFEILGCFR